MSIYRQYEDPHALEERLKELQERRAKCADEYELYEIDMDIAELKDRINFAWQDDEYECEGGDDY